MTTLKVGIASYEDMKARTMAVARGENRIAARWMNLRTSPARQNRTCRAH